jgi:hypothetical protein
VGEAAQVGREATPVNDTEEIDVAALIAEHGPAGAEEALRAQGYDATTASEAVALELGEGEDGWDLSK